MELEDIVTAQIEQQDYGDANFCVCCGAVIPEGRHVCVACEEEIEDRVTQGGDSK
jgi:RNA polymerase-binding transcription factor DksA